jgi:hypothetical protein
MVMLGVYFVTRTGGRHAKEKIIKTERIKESQCRG